MSMNGRLRAEMLARQKEELRKQRVREQCNQMISSMEEKLHACINDVYYSNIFESDGSSIKEQIQGARKQIQNNPDTALSDLSSISRLLSISISKAISVEKKWSEDKIISYQKISELVDEVRSLTMRSPKYSKDRDKLISKLENLKNTSTTSSSITSTLSNVRSEITSLTKLDEKEEIRKETVKKIVSILKEQGFSIGKPILKEEVVHVTGKLPSGKKVLFQIHSEGSIDFDLDGYSGQTCKNEIDGVIEKLNEGEEIESSIEQFVWHNPDKIKKGSKEFPYGNGQTQYMRK